MKKQLLFVLSCITVLALVACKEASTPSEYSIWSLPTTEKIKQDDVNFANKGKAELKYSAVKNEHEGYQLFVSANANIKDIHLETSDLKSEQGVISKDNFTVNVINYVELIGNVDAATYGLGMYPDPLIPQAAKEKAGENKANKNENYGFYVSLYVPKDTIAGDYSANFTLKVDDQSYTIPVTAKIYNYTLTDDVNTKSMFTYRYDRIGIGEKDNSVDMMRKYYEFFQDYRISLQELPVEALTGDEVGQCASEYYGDYTTFSLLTHLGNISTGVESKVEVLKEQILSLAEYSTADKDLVSMASLYGLDEPDLKDVSVLKSCIRTLDCFKEVKKNALIAIESDLTGKYDSFKSITDYKNIVLNIPFIVPTDSKGFQAISELLNLDYAAQEESVKTQIDLTIDYLNKLDILCPVFHAFDDGTRQFFVDICKQYNIKLWWYGCTMPRSPYPNYHIGDTSMLSPRTVSWLQKKYNIEGNLYWGAASYSDEYPSNLNNPLDLYDIPYLRSDLVWPAGDGGLTYPGLKYGIYGPVSSLRLEAIRDGLEEYELLYDLENKLDTLCLEYGITEKENILDYFYDRISYSGIKMNKDGESQLDFVEVREELIDMLTNIDDSSGFIMYDFELDGKYADIDFYVRNEFNVTVNGDAPTLVSGNHYTYRLDLSKNELVVFEISDGISVYKQTRYIGKAKNIVLDFDHSDNLDFVSASEGTTYALTNDTNKATKGNALEANVTSKFVGDDYEDLIFSPSISFDKSGFSTNVDFSKIDALTLDINNLDSSPCAFKIKLASGSREYTSTEFNLVSGRNTINFKLSSIKWQYLSQVDKISFCFENAGNMENPKVYHLVFDNLCVND